MVAAIEDSLAECLAALGGLGLAELDKRAEMHTRVDRKYVLPIDQAAEVIAGCGQGYAALEIAGARRFSYESQYFDTPERAAFHDAATGRRWRFKVRTRLYVAQGTCTLEVKTRNRRGATVKERLSYAAADRRLITAEGEQFIDGVLCRPVAARLSPSVLTGYDRSTIVEAGGSTRATIDTRFVVAAAPDAPWRGFGPLAIVETKTAGHPAPLDRALWAAGVRPIRVSKFAVAVALAHPGIGANRWNRALRRHFDWHPAPLDIAAEPPPAKI